MKFLSVLHAAPMQNLKVRIAINAEYIKHAAIVVILFIICKRVCVLILYPNLQVLFSLRLLIIILLPILLLKFNTF